MSWPFHCGRPMLFLGTDAAFDPKLAKAEELVDPKSLPKHYYCQLCGKRIRLTHKEPPPDAQEGA